MGKRGVKERKRVGPRGKRMYALGTSAFTVKNIFMSIRTNIKY